MMRSFLLPYPPGLQVRRCNCKTGITNTWGGNNFSSGVSPRQIITNFLQEIMYVCIRHTVVGLMVNRISPQHLKLWLSSTQAIVFHAHLHSCNTLLIKSSQLSLQFLFPISASVSQSFNNIWRYMLAQKREERSGNRYFQNLNWDVLFTAFAIGLKILQFILISTCLNFITPVLSDVIPSGILWENICPGAGASSSQDSPVPPPSPLV